MPSSSAAQQSLMGQAWALRSGEISLGQINPKYRKQIKAIADGEMTDKELKKFASTKSKNLPEHVKDGKPVKEGFEVEDEESLEEKGTAMAGATSPIVTSKSVPGFSPGIKLGGGIKPIVPYLNPDVKKPAGGKKMTHMADYRDFINKKKLNEISSETFKKAIDVSKSRGTDNRTYKMGRLYFNQFIGKPFMEGKIIDIGIRNPQQGNYKEVSIEFERNIYHDSGYHKGQTITKKDYIYYDIDKDDFNLGDFAIDRKDAVILSKIAQQINPDTKYKETGRHFKIKGY
jgi:hypothetical protein